MLFSVVDELKGVRVSDFLTDMYDPEFWYPLMPLKSKKIEKIEPMKYRFEVQDNIPLDITGTWKIDFKAEGTISVTEYGEQGEKGFLWELNIDVIEPKAIVRVRIRVKDVGKSMKAGVYLQELDYDIALLKDGIGREVVLLAGRLKIREMFEKIRKHLAK
ncbi:MAG: hypothetical protein ACTSWY_07235 [Promethearchaeota archaeon]